MQISKGQVEAFVEKENSDSSPGYINAGVYIFNRELIQSIRPGVVESLEKTLFPSLIARGERIQAYCTGGYFIDMGTPQRLQKLRSDFLRGVVPLRGADSAKRLSS